MTPGGGLLDAGRRPARCLHTDVRASDLHGVDPVVVRSAEELAAGDVRQGGPDECTRRWVTGATILSERISQPRTPVRGRRPSGRMPEERIHARKRAVGAVRERISFPRQRLHGGVPLGGRARIVGGLTGRVRPLDVGRRKSSAHTCYERDRVTSMHPTARRPARAIVGGEAQLLGRLHRRAVGRDV